MKQFLGYEVTIVTNITLTDRKSSYPLVASGYLINFDKEFVYLGTTPEKTTRAIRRDTVMEIDILESIKEHLPEAMQTQDNVDKYEAMLEDYNEVDPTKFN